MHVHLFAFFRDTLPRKERTKGSGELMARKDVVKSEGDLSIENRKKKSFSLRLFKDQKTRRIPW
jgi:hypothetical protein